MNYEVCIHCKDLTGRAGRFDDSLYTEDGTGPYCENCFNRFTRHERSNQPPSWPSIESAPKDKTILVYRQEWNKAYKARYNEKLGQWCFCNGCIANDPTHWMPLLTCEEN
jgi:hypothetical protein